MIGTTAKQQLLFNSEKVSIGSGPKYPGRMTTRAGVALGLVTTGIPSLVQSSCFLRIYPVSCSSGDLCRMLTWLTLLTISCNRYVPHKMEINPRCTRNWSSNFGLPCDTFHSYADRLVTINLGTEPNIGRSTSNWINSSNKGVSTKINWEPPNKCLPPTGFSPKWQFNQKMQL